MSSVREPLWYCHACHAEMRPMMIPGPCCDSCHSSFVEMMENPSDDPRDFRPVPGDLDEDFHTDQEDFLLGINDLMQGAGGRNGFTLEINRSRSPGGNTRTFVVGPRAGSGSDPVTSLSEFIRAGSGVERSMPPQRAMINHLLLALAQRYPGGIGPEGGRWGDYVYNQEALDQIMTQLMENSNAHRPVPATEEIIEKLPREVLTEGCDILQKDCAVCKDSFKIGTEDPDEQVIVTLPCKHSYHSPCIIPWLKNSGTCPVCRHQLVPQPGSPTASSESEGSGSPQMSSASSSSGVFNNFFSYLGGGSGNTGNSSGTGQSRSQFDSRSSGRRGPPGGWGEELD